MSQSSLPAVVRDSTLVSGFRSPILEPVEKNAAFAIYPFEPIVSLLGEPLSEQDVIANLLFRATQVFEETDLSVRQARLKQYQSEIFVAMNDAYCEGHKSCYTIFSVFNSGKVKSVSPALRPLRHSFFTKFAFQPILRFIFARPENRLNPNLVLQAMGPRAFLQMRDALFLEIAELNAKSMEICFQFLQGEKGIFHDSVRFAFSFFPENVHAPLVPGSRWNLFLIFEKICDRKSPEMLRHFYGFARPDIRREIREIAAGRNEVTGLLNLPWAHYLLADLPDLPVSEISLPFPGQREEISDIRENGALDPSKIFLVDSPEKVAAIFREIQEEKLISLNFQVSEDSGNVPEFFSIATPNAAYVVDLAPLRTSRKFSFEASVTFLLDFILKTSEIKKITNNAPALLQAISNFLKSGDFEFENIEDLRKPRIRRIKKFRAIDEAIEIDTSMGKARSFEEIVEIGKKKFPDQIRETEEIEMLHGYQSLKSLTRRFLGFTISTNFQDLAARPLRPAAVAAAGQEAHAMLLLSVFFEKNGF